MKKKLLHLSVESPCDTPWSEMAPTSNNRRHCDQCAKEVIDFTRMNDAQLIRFFSALDRPVCGRYRADQLDQPLEMLVPPEPVRIPMKALAIAAGISILAPQLQAQSTPTPPLVEQLHSDANRATDQGSRNITGFAKDAQTGEPLIGASILIKGTSQGTVTDLDGQFSITVPKRHSTLVISYTGFEETTLNLTDNTTHYTVALKQGIDLPVVVVSALDPHRSCHTFRGGWFVVQEIEEETATEKTSRANLLYLSTAQAFPNPSQQAPQIRLESSQVHQLQLQLFNAQGQALWQDYWEIIPGQNQRYITLNWGNLPSGSYYLSLEDENDQKKILPLVKP